MPNDIRFYVPQLIVYAVLAYDTADEAGDTELRDHAETLLSWCVANLHTRMAEPPPELLLSIGSVLAQYPEPIAVSVSGRRLRVEAA